MDCGLLAIEVRGTGGRLPPFRWEMETSQAGLKEAVVAKFVVTDAAATRFEVEFYLDRADGDLPPQIEILLQLVADAIEALLHRVVRARAAAATGHLRPVG